MIAVQVHDFRGCVRAEIECNPVALVAGRNGAGKTSIAQGAAAVLTGNATPVAGLPRGTAGMLVRTGTDAAVCHIKGELGSARIDWPAGQPTSQGEPPHASLYAAGLASVATMSAQERVRTLSEYLKADPTRNDLRTALDRASEATVDTLWQLIQDKGWDGAHSVRRERGAELKGQWRQVTGAQYGSRVAASWRPDLEEEALSEPELVRLVEETDRERNRAVAAQAVSSAERDRLGREASTIDVVVADVERADAEVARIQDAIAAAKERRAALPSGEQPSTMSCPHCGGALMLRRVSLVETRLEAAGPPTPEADLKANRLAIAELDGTIERLLGELVGAQRALTATRAAVAAATNARVRLAEMTHFDPTDAPDLEAAKSALSRAEKRLAAFRQKGQADDLARRIAGNDVMLELLAPEGLRAKRLAEVREVFNSQVLGSICADAGWQPVAIDPAMMLTYAGRAYPLLSASEQYRARIVLQVAMARLDDSSMVVIDAADILDAPTRTGLFRVLEGYWGTHALVCMTASRREQLPNLADAGLGNSYWVEAGIAEPLPAPPREAAA